MLNFKVSNKIAFTGEITLRGNILKVGSIKEKIIGQEVIKSVEPGQMIVKIVNDELMVEDAVVLY